MATESHGLEALELARYVKRPKELCSVNCSNGSGHAHTSSLGWSTRAFDWRMFVVDCDKATHLCANESTYLKRRNKYGPQRIK